MENTSQQTGKVYQPQGNVTWLIVAAIVILGIHFAVLTIFTEGINFWIFNIILLPVYAFFFYLLYVQMTQSSITVYANGLEWRHGGSRLFAEWDNLSQIERREEGDATSYGIKLHESVEVEANNLLDKLFFSSPNDYIRLTGIVTLPMNFEGVKKGSVIDMGKFIDTDFGQDLKRYAPRLFDNPVDS